MFGTELFTYPTTLPSQRQTITAWSSLPFILLWGDWLKAMGDNHEEELFSAMLDASDCFQSSTFDSLHGYYRSALANLRSAFELVAIGTLGNLAPNDDVYLRWKKNEGDLAFPSCRKRLGHAVKEPVRTLLFKQNGWMEGLYRKLCGYAHSRPDSSDGQIWESNRPVYVTAAAKLVFKLQVSTYATCYVLTKVGRPSFVLPKNSEFIFETPGLLWRDEIAVAYRSLSPVS